MKTSFVISLLLNLIVASTAGASEPWPEIPVPPQSKVEWIGDNMRVNGVPTRIQQFHSKADRARVIAEYRAYWTGAYPQDPAIVPLGTATVISQQHGPYFMTVKAEDDPDGGSHGLIAVSRIGGSNPELNAGDLPLLPNAKVLSVVESDDPGQRSREVVVFNSQPAQSVRRFYEAAYSNRGWQKVQSNEVPRTTRSAGGAFLVFARKDAEVQLSVTGTNDGRATTLIANLVTKGTVPREF